jgi:hypothetical protein
MRGRRPYHGDVPDKPDTPLARAYTPTALPSVTARLLAFVAILLGGLCGGLIGYAVVDLQCGTEGSVVVPVEAAPDQPPETVPATPSPRPSPTERGCGVAVGLGALVGALVGAGGVAVVSVLVLRAMSEWRRELEVDDPPGPDEV